MKDEEELKSGHLYHIYNCGTNGANLFRDTENYHSFLGLMDKYVLPVADLLAWVLMPNHFHFLVRIKENVGYRYSIADRDQKGEAWFDEHKWETMDLSDMSACVAPDSFKQLKPHLHFLHLFNAYTEYYNQQTTRYGALFECSFKPKYIHGVPNFKRIILYIHHIPVHLGLCSHPGEYAWSNYLTYTPLPSKLKRNKLLNLIDVRPNFNDVFNEKIDFEKIDKWLRK